MVCPSCNKFDGSDSYGVSRGISFLGLQSLIFNKLGNLSLKHNRRILKSDHLGHRHVMLNVS